MRVIADMPRPYHGQALYECVRCRHQWGQRPARVTCPKCGSLYVNWLNYNLHDWLGDGYGIQPRQRAK